MTIEENIAFPLRMRKIADAEARRRVAEVLELVHLPHVAKRTPRELSGGQQQRIALARCLVYRPSIVLMDEPLGALDKKLRDQMQLEIKRIHRELKTTIVYVTHDQEEAMTMSDRICLMNAGRIEQLGTPDDLYFRPRSLFVADFLGESNLLPGKISRVSPGDLDIIMADRSLPACASGNGSRFTPGQDVKVMVRPQNLSVSIAGDANGKLVGRLTDIMVSGSLTKLYMDAVTPGMPPLIAAYPTRASTGITRSALLALDWHPAEAFAIADEQAA